jgi:hypothetical protein
VLAREQAVAFVVLRDTKISGKGRPSLLPPAGRRLRLTDALQQGDLVNVTYRESGNRKLAIRIDRVESDR